MQQVPQGIAITSANAPGVAYAGGGLVQMKSISQVLAEERAAAQDANNAPVIQGLAFHIRRLWTNARTAKEMTVEQRMFRSLRQRRGEYDPDKLALIAEQGGSTIYMMLTSNKCRAASSWLRDVLLTTSDDKPWSVKPSPSPDIDPSMVADIIGKAQQQIQQMMASGANPSDGDVRQLLLNMKDEATAITKEIASRAAERMEDKMQDQLLEGGWIDAFSDFIDDIVTFPTAFLKGPVVRKRPKLQWVPGPNGTYTPDLKDALVLEWERVDPFMMYPAADARAINDSYLVERHRLGRSDLEALIGVDGYSEAAIRAVLDDHGKGGLHEWVNADTQKASAEGQSTMAVSTNPSELIDALQFWGSVQGRLLVEWGLDAKQVPDPLKEYHIEAWLIGSWVIKASINPDPLGRKPYYKASYEEVPGVFWGNSVSDLCRDTQDVCNATARALCNNMGMASGPQVVYNIDRLPQGENITQMYPWKTWQVTSDPLNGTGPLMEFFQPNSMAQELLTIYEKFSVLADEYTGIPRYMTGDAPAGGAGRTASGMSMLMSNAGKSIKQVIANIDVSITEPAINRLYFYNMRFADDPDLKGDVNIIARGAMALIAKEAAQQRRNEFLQLCLSNQIVNQVVGMEGIAALLRESARTLDMNTDDIVPPLEILKERWAKAAAAQQAMQAQQQAMQMQQGPPAPGQMGPPARPPMPVLPPGMRLQVERDAAGAVTGARMVPANAAQEAGHGTPPRLQSDRHALVNGAPVTNHFQSRGKQ